MQIQIGLLLIELSFITRLYWAVKHPIHINCTYIYIYDYKPEPIGQSVVSVTADPGVASWIPVWSYTFGEIDHEIISMIILLLPPIQERLLSVTSESICMKYWLIAQSNLPRKQCS